MWGNSLRIIVAALGYLGGDYAIPWHVIEDVKKMNLNVEIIDLSLGAIKAASMLSILSPDRLIVLATRKKGKKELRIYRPIVEEDEISSWMEIYSNVRGYYMDLESFIKASHALGVLPKETIVIECEPEREDGISLSEWGLECKKLMIEKLREILAGTFNPTFKDVEEI